MRLIAHNIRSLHNVGSIFRSADAFGIERLYLSGYTGTPPRREIAKVSLGSEQRVPWEHREDILALIRDLRAQGFRTVALENRPGAVPIQSSAALFRSGDRLALLLGNEVDGVPAELLQLCDAVVEIPLPGGKRSLNVSVACGIALFAISAFQR